MRKAKGSPRTNAIRFLNFSFSVLYFVMAAGVCLPASSYGETLDKIVAIVDSHIITLSDVRQERAIRGVLGETTITDADVTQQLIESYLIETQLTGLPGIDVSDEEIAM